MKERGSTWPKAAVSELAAAGASQAWGSGDDFSLPEMIFLAFLVSCVTLLCMSNSPLPCGPCLRLWGREGNTVPASPCSPLEEGATVMFHNFCSYLSSGK